MLRVLVEQEPEVSGRAVGRSDGQEHRVVALATPPFSIGDNTGFAAKLMVSGNESVPNGDSFSSLARWLRGT